MKASNLREILRCRAILNSLLFGGINFNTLIVLGKSDR